jgi:hypothetical protein
LVWAKERLWAGLDQLRGEIEATVGALVLLGEGWASAWALQPSWATAAPGRPGVLGKGRLDRSAAPGPTLTTPEGMQLDVIPAANGRLDLRISVADKTLVGEVVLRRMVGAGDRSGRCDTGVLAGGSVTFRGLQPGLFEIRVAEGNPVRLGVVAADQAS